jgi:periplasmic divalent cation tolerance protein
MASGLQALGRRFHPHRPRRGRMGSQIHIVQTTLPGAWIEAEVGDFAQRMIEAGAACIQHETVRSIYRWQGEIESESEWRLQMKVSLRRLDGVLDKLNELHPYDIPQVLVLQANASTSYGDWVDSA